MYLWTTLSRSVLTVTSDSISTKSGSPNSSTISSFESNSTFSLDKAEMFTASKGSSSEGRSSGSSTKSGSSVVSFGRTCASSVGSGSDGGLSSSGASSVSTGADSAAASAAASSTAFASAAAFLIALTSYFECPTGFFFKLAFDFFSAKSLANGLLCDNGRMPEPEVFVLSVLALSGNASGSCDRLRARDLDRARIVAAATRVREGSLEAESSRSPFLADKERLVGSPGFSRRPKESELASDRVWGAKQSVLVLCCRCSKPKKNERLARKFV
mmetsp:Transcript_10365/g.26069  ORF Transcript_10365/g.26069 Transcript_10365/m.26069 type:complete len:272 (-) Transcript_10365:280-1095(-)